MGISIRNLDNVNLLNEKRYATEIGELVRCVHEEIGAPVVLGGSGYSLAPQSMLRNSGADYGIAGEGECLMVGLAESLERGRAPARGTILRNARPIEGSGLCGGYYDPAILKSYLDLGTIAPVRTKRGCGLHCEVLRLSGAGRQVAAVPARRRRGGQRRTAGEGPRRILCVLYRFLVQ